MNPRTHHSALLGLLLLTLTACTTDRTREAGLERNPNSPVPWTELNEVPLRQKITQLIPVAVKDRAGWANDLQKAYAHLKIPTTPENFCASIAIIEQESNFQADPAVPSLPAIVNKELEQRADKYGIPRLLLSTALLKASPDGRSYRERIDALKTEKQLNDLFLQMIAELPFGKRLLAGYNPVRTAGAMQVSVQFAEQQVSEKGYPYPLNGTVRDEVFTRRGGVYFGSAILLDYPAPYSEFVYRFADFNAGRYASRNAAFQQASGTLSGKALTLDGDLLAYKEGRPLDKASEVELALQKISGKLAMSPSDIRHDLLLEKSADFGNSRLFQRVFQLAENAAGHALPRQLMPGIELKSPKITRKLTTEWFARRVESRFQNCLKRNPDGRPEPG